LDQHPNQVRLHQVSSAKPFGCASRSLDSHRFWAHQTMEPATQRSERQACSAHRLNELLIVWHTVKLPSANQVGDSVATCSCISRILVHIGLYVLLSLQLTEVRSYNHLRHNTKSAPSLLVELFRTRLAVLLATLLRWHVCWQVSCATAS